MIDATAGFTEQDSKVAGYAHQQGKGCVVAVNKWDAVADKDGAPWTNNRKKTGKKIFPSWLMCPSSLFSAKTGQRLDRLFELINFVNTQNAMRISTGMLKRTFCSY
jgi:GTP-binding protein